MIDKPLLQAFSIRTEADIERALQSSADYLLLDQGGGGLKQQPGDGWRKGSDKDTGSGENGANTGNRFLIKKTKDRNDQTGRCKDLPEA